MVLGRNYISGNVGFIKVVMFIIRLCHVLVLSFFVPEVQRAWHMLILSPICYWQFSPDIRTNYVILNEISDVNSSWTISSAVV